MRAYFFTNTWLSGIQKGLQVAHCVAEMSQKAPGKPGDNEFIDWIDNHKTIIILDGGSHADLVDIKKLFEDENNFYPWASFSEDEESLSGAMTSVGIVLPELIYESAKGLREGDYEEHELERKFSIFEQELIELLNSRSLAR